MNRIVKLIVFLFYVIINAFTVDKSNKNKIEHVEKESDYVYYEYETEIIDKIAYEFFIDTEGVFQLKEKGSGVIQYSQNKNVTSFQIKDFNQDGYKDVIIEHPSNRVLETLLLYNSKLKKFVLIENFINYPNSKKIDSSEFYYSYQGAGCAQNDWISRLYIISNYKIIDKGLIKGSGCLKNEQNGMYIYKYVENDTIQVKYIKNENGFGQEKFDIINAYWGANKATFK